MATLATSVVFGWAALTHLVNPSTLRAEHRRLFGRAGGWSAPAQSLTEATLSLSLATAFALDVSRVQAVNRFAAVALLGLFSAYLVAALRRAQGEAVTCACFGGSFRMTWVHPLRNLVLIAGLAAEMTSGASSEPWAVLGGAVFGVLAVTVPDALSFPELGDGSQPSWGQRKEVLA